MSEWSPGYGARGLRLGDDLVVPPTAVTQTFGILAVRGAGKSNAAAVMAEQMHAAALPFVVVDPVGSWWGLRSSRDGRGAGLPVPIFGGRRGDVPLERSGGAELATFLVEKRLSCVLDLSEFSEGDKTRFLIDFAERLYRANEAPLHLFLEEADDYIPQRPFREQARLLRAWENIVRRGRSRGLGMTMITQRSAAINKNVLTQIETLFVLRTTSPNDRKAVQGWVDYHGESREVLATLPSLADGEAWVWSPNWLKTFRRVRIHRRATFDSGATPKQARAAAPPATLADVDLGELTARFAASIERAKADDPKELRREIAELKRQLAAKPATAVERVEVPVLAGAELQRVEGVVERLGWILEKQEAQAAAVREELAALKAALARASGSRPVAVARASAASPVGAPPQRQATAAPGRRASEGGAALASGERKILTALAQYPDGRTKVQVAILTGYAHNGGGYNNYLSALRSRGLIAGSDRLVITDAGAAALGDYDPLPTGAALLDYWLGRLGKAERAALSELAAAYPKALAKEDLATRAGYEASGGGFNNALSKLRTLELIEGRGELRASAALFG